MRQRWTRLCERTGANPNDLFNDLRSRYAEPQRAYHTLQHIEQCLGEFDEARTLPDHPLEVEMAIWFHDAIYDPRAHDNEERSSALAREACASIGLPQAFGACVGDLVLATKHVESPAGCDAQVLIDVDLSILGRPEVEFDEYERNVRREYEWVPEEMFRMGRAGILARFLERPSIYSTGHFRAKYEAAARRNLARSIERLNR